MVTLSTIVFWIVIGLVVGLLGRLLAPGRNPIGLVLTIAIGIVGALLGGFITAALVGIGHPLIAFVVALVIAAALVSFISHPRSRRYWRR